MDADAERKLREAGRIAREARELGARKAEEGMSLRELAELIEGAMRAQGAQPAFPTCLSIDDQAAHFSPASTSEVTLKRGDVLKLDLGAQIDGYVGDTATTVEIGTQNWSGLIEAAHDALNTAVEMIAIGTHLGAVGAAISRAIRARGFKPIRNLTGHSIERYVLHAGLSVPNVEDDDAGSVREGMVLALEPFSTTGLGVVEGGRPGNIFRLLRPQSPSDPRARALLEAIQRDFHTLPFAERWCAKIDPKAQQLLFSLVRKRTLMSYPVLMEAGHGIVAQAEHTVIVTSDGCDVTT